MSQTKVRLGDVDTAWIIDVEIDGVMHRGLTVAARVTSPRDPAKIMVSFMDAGVGPIEADPDDEVTRHLG